MQLHVGLAAHRGSLKNFPFDLLEFAVTASLPKPKTLREMKESAPRVRFALRLPPDVMLDPPEKRDLARVTAARDALDASFLVIPSSPRFTPIERNRALLAELCDELRAQGCRLAWEPRGVWNPGEAEDWARELDLVLVRDLTQDSVPHGDVVYTRLLPFGSGARVSQHAMETLAGQLEGCEEAYIVIQGQGAKATRSFLREVFELGEQ